MYHRYNDSAKTPDNGIGMAMFVTDENKARNYGTDHWTYNGVKALPAIIIVESVISKMINADWLPDYLDWFRDNAEWDAFRDRFDPEDINESAGIWDDPASVEWIWDNALDPMDVDALTTRDGAILFNMTLAVYVGEKE
jgi:hypothetical protein